MWTPNHPSRHMPSFLSSQWACLELSLISLPQKPSPVLANNSGLLALEPLDMISFINRLSLQLCQINYQVRVSSDIQGHATSTSILKVSIYKIMELKSVVTKILSRSNDLFHNSEFNVSFLYPCNSYSELLLNFSVWCIVLYISICFPYKS